MLVVAVVPVTIAVRLSPLAMLAAANPADAVTTIASRTPGSFLIDPPFSCRTYSSRTTSRCRLSPRLAESQWLPHNALRQTRVTFRAVSEADAHLSRQIADALRDRAFRRAPHPSRRADRRAARQTTRADRPHQRPRVHQPGTRLVPLQQRPAARGLATRVQIGEMTRARENGLFYSAGGQSLPHFDGTLIAFRCPIRPPRLGVRGALGR